jgi:Tol biopolymer transport system component
VRALIALAALAACESKSPPAPPPPSGPPAPELPGAIWFVHDGVLSRLANGKRLDVKSDVPLFPSRFALADGRLVAIASRGDGSAESEQLALVAADGSVTRIGPRAAMVRDPAVDPAGKWIAIAANLDGHSDLYRVELATQQVTRLTDNREGNFAPVVLGDDLVFVSSRDGNSEIYRLSGARLTAFHKDDWMPAPSPVGMSIAFVSDREGPVRIFTMRADGTAVERLTTRTRDEGDEVEPMWSRDGKRLAFIVERGGERRIHVREAGTERVIAAPAGARDSEPSFSPDGRWIAFSREAKGTSELLAFRLSDGQTVQLGPGRLPRWQ